MRVEGKRLRVKSSGLRVKGGAEAVCAHGESFKQVHVTWCRAKHVLRCQRKFAIIHI